MYSYMHIHVYSHIYIVCEVACIARSMCAYSLSCVRLFATLWPVAHHISVSKAILQARILEWVVMPSSRS